jgi:alpha-N-arabinofuranosidase
MKTLTNNTARVYLDTNRVIGEIQPLLFSGFAEHMGRCIYGGIYEPASPCADEHGFRADVLAALRQLNFRMIRYPGGNFLSGYKWFDGVGRRAERPRRRDLAWQSTETNQFGTNEFLEFCRCIDARPMLGVNLGTGSIAEAANLVEYCNAPAGTQYADMRVAHGYREPHGVQYWCLGNEMDGPWQIGHLDMADYARKAREASKLMRWQDPSLKLVLSGSSNSGMPTFPEWDRVVLESCWDYVDHLSLHYYAGNRENDTASYLASTVCFEEQVDTLAATLRYVQSRLRSRHEVSLAWDEWNVCYKVPDVPSNWAEAPHIAEEIYNVEDALVVAQWLSVFLRRCNVLGIACLAQIVNVIAPILTASDCLMRQTIFYPFMFFSRYASGLSLDVLCQSPRYDTRAFGDVPVLDVSASYDPADNSSAVFLVNRSQADAVITELVWQSKAPRRVSTMYQYGCGDPKASNTFEGPDLVVPQVLAGVPLDDHTTTLRLPPLSLTVVVCA